MGNRIILVGMNNPHSMKPQYALYPLPPGCAGNRLWNMMSDATGGIEGADEFSQEEYVEMMERTNLVRGEWHEAHAAANAAHLWRNENYSKREVILLGDRVHKAFERAGAPVKDLVPFEWRKTSLLGRIVRIPHPSGRSRAWNDPAVRKVAAKFFREVVDHSRTYANQRRESADRAAAHEE